MKAFCYNACTKTTVMITKIQWNHLTYTNTFCYNACTKTTVMITNPWWMPLSHHPAFVIISWTVFLLAVVQDCGFCTALIILSFIFHRNLIFGSDIGHETENKGPKKSSNWRRLCRLLYRARYSSFLILNA